MFWIWIRMDPQHFGKLDPDPHLDPHQSDKLVLPTKSFKIFPPSFYVVSDQFFFFASALFRGQILYLSDRNTRIEPGTE